MSDENIISNIPATLNRKKAPLTAQERVSQQLNHLTSELGFLSMQGLMNEVEALIPEIGQLTRQPATIKGCSNGPNNQSCLSNRIPLHPIADLSSDAYPHWGGTARQPQTNQLTIPEGAPPRSSANASSAHRTHGPAVLSHPGQDVMGPRGAGYSPVHGVLPRQTYAASGGRPAEQYTFMQSGNHQDLQAGGGGASNDKPGQVRVGWTSSSIWALMACIRMKACYWLECTGVDNRAVCGACRLWSCI